MNTTQVYNEAVGKTKPEERKAPEFDEIKNAQWLALEETRGFLKKISEARDEDYRKLIYNAFAPGVSDLEIRRVVEECAIIECVLNLARKGTYATS